MLLASAPTLAKVCPVPLADILKCCSWSAEAELRNLTLLLHKLQTTVQQQQQLSMHIRSILLKPLYIINEQEQTILSASHCKHKVVKHFAAGDQQQGSNTL